MELPFHRRFSLTAALCDERFICNDIQLKFDIELYLNVKTLMFNNASQMSVLRNLKSLMQAPLMLNVIFITERLLNKGHVQFC